MVEGRRIVDLTEYDTLKFVRVGNNYLIGPLNHLNQTGALLSLKTADPAEMRKYLENLGQEIDMGFVRRRREDGAVTLPGVSGTLLYPRLDEAIEVRARTAEIIQRDYPGEIIIAGKFNL